MPAHSLSGTPAARRPLRSRTLVRELPGPRWLPLLVVSFASAASGCTPGGDNGPLTELEDVAADEILYVTSRNLTRDGVREGMLEADSIHLWHDSTHARVYGLTLFLYDRQGREKGRVTADAGRLSSVSAELWAYGNALLNVPADELNEEREIAADELFFDLDRERIWTNVPVRMMRGGCRVTGDGFETDLAFNDLRIEAPREGGCPES